MKKLMNALVIAAMTAIVMPATAVPPEVDPNSSAIGWTAFEFGLASPASIPWGYNCWDIRGLNLSLLFADSVDLAGVALTPGGTLTHEDCRGIEFGGVFNYNSRDVWGLRASVGPNITRGTTYGVDLGLCGYRTLMKGVDISFIGSMQDEMVGLQIAGVANVNRAEFTGVEIAGVINMSKKTTGFNLAGVMNQTDELHGCQIGLINYTETCPWGFQIGLINIIMQNKVKILPIANWYF